MIEEAIVHLLKTDAAVVALIGGGEQARIYPGFAPAEATYPRLVYHRITTGDERSHGGYSGLTRTRLQFDVLALVYAQAKALAAAVRERLRDYCGRDDQHATAAGRLIQDIEKVNDFDAPEPPKDAGDRPVRRVILEFEVWHAEE